MRLLTKNVVRPATLISFNILEVFRCTFPTNRCMVCYIGTAYQWAARTKYYLSSCVFLKIRDVGSGKLKKKKTILLQIYQKVKYNDKKLCVVMFVPPLCGAGILIYIYMHYGMRINVYVYVPVEFVVAFDPRCVLRNINRYNKSYSPFPHPLEKTTRNRIKMYVIINLTPKIKK